MTREQFEQARELIYQLKEYKIGLESIEKADSIIIGHLSLGSRFTPLAEEEMGVIKRMVSCMAAHRIAELEKQLREI